MMTRGLAVAGLLSLLAFPALAENPVSDHAKLWDKARDRGGEASREATKSSQESTRQATQNTEEPETPEQPASN